MIDPSSQPADRTSRGAEPAPVRHRTGRPPRALVAAVASLLLIAAVELTARALFPLPPVVGFERLAYSQVLAAGGGPVPSMAHRTLWWWSEPDGARYSRGVNLHGFHDGEWRLRPRRGRPRVAFVGDSFVEGLGAPERRTLVDAFEGAARRSGAPVEGMNLGAGGFGFADYAPLIRDAVQIFEPGDLVLVVYMNDLYQLPDLAPALAGTVEPERPDRRVPRLVHVVAELRAGRRVPLRWHEPAGEPQPIEVGPRLDRDPELSSMVERFVEPELRESMKAGRLNPAIVNLLVRSERVLPEPVDPEPQVRALAAFAERHGVRLSVVYLPSLNQVSDAYLPAQRRLSAPIAAPSLTGERFQRHARDLGRACAAAGVAFLDLTPALAAAESSGERLYWPYDSHMTEAGYALTGRTIFEWWSAQRERRD